MEYMTTLIEDNYNCKPIIESDVIEIINNLKDSKSADTNNIILKNKAGGWLSCHIVRLVASSLSAVVLPGFNSQSR